MILTQVLHPESNDPRDVAAFVDAFPGGDIAAHRIAHERQAEADADFKSLRRSLIEKGAFGLLAALGEKKG